MIKKNIFVTGLAFVAMCVCLLLFSCEQHNNIPVSETEIVLKFGVADGGGGTLTAKRGNETITTDSKVKQGDEIIFTAKAENKEWSIGEWTVKEGSEAEKTVNGNEKTYTHIITKNTTVMVRFVKETDLPSLVPTYLSIRGEEVKDLSAEKLTLSVFADQQDRILADDIVAKFTLGNDTTEEKIRVWMKHKKDTVDEVSFRNGSISLQLVVPAKKGKYQSWTKKIDIKQRIPCQFRLNNSKKNIQAQGEKKDGSFAVTKMQTFEVEGNKLHLNIFNDSEQFKSVHINNKDVSSEIKEYEDDEGSKVIYKIPLTNMVEGDDVNIVVVPKSDDFAESRFLFKVKGNATASPKKIMPKLSIAGNWELPQKTFLEKLTTNDKPTYRVKEDSAKIKIRISEYERDFLLKEVKINDVKQTLTKGDDWVINYYVDYDAKNLTGSPTEIKIEFVSDDESFCPTLTWKFNLQTGGELPPLPQVGNIHVFTINGMGKISILHNTFQEDFYNHLNDDSKPVYKFDGGSDGKLDLLIGSYARTGQENINSVMYKIDNTVETTKTDKVSEGKSILHKFSCTKSLADQAEHEVEIEITPKDTAKYSKLVLKFKVQNTGALPPIPGFKCYIDRELEISGYKMEDPFDGELIELSMQTDEDNIAKVEVGLENNLKECVVEEFMGNNGKFYAIEEYVKLPTDGKLQKYIIRMHPKESSKYKVTDFVCFLHGSKVSENNAKFYRWNNAPYIYHEKIASYDDKSGSIREYGVKTAEIHVQTVSPRAKVKYRFIDLDEETIAMPGDSNPEIKEMVNNGVGGNTATLTFFEDKPTHLHVFVEAENGETDELYGSWYKSYSYVPVKFATKEPNAYDDLTTEAYKEIIIDKTNLKKDKLYVAFAISTDRKLSGYGYSFDNKYAYPAYQKKPEELEEVNNWLWYKSEIDVSSLEDDNSLDIFIPILTNGKSCFNYKMKIKTE